MVETFDGQTRRRLATRERLYEAAVDLITERGYEVTTFDEIAARAGTSRRTCFNHFPRRPTSRSSGPAVGACKPPRPPGQRLRTAPPTCSTVFAPTSTSSR